jgi:hypothetical protein
MVTDTITEDNITFLVSSDDAEQENDEIDALFDDDLDAGWEGAPEDQNILTTGIRFRNIPVPQNAVIDSAYITVWSHEDKGAEDVAELTIYAEQTDDAATFTEDKLITDRAATAKVNWKVAEKWELWKPYRTPELKSIVQEVVRRPGWNAGNAIAFVFAGKNQGPSDFENAREWESFENIADPEDGGDGQNHPERVPRLTIYYSSPLSTGVKDRVAITLPLELYPNPVRTGAISLNLKQSGNGMLQILDMQGRSIYHKEGMLQATETIQGVTLPAGWYTVKVWQNNQWRQGQLVVQ